MFSSARSSSRTTGARAISCSASHCLIKATRPRSKHSNSRSRSGADPHRGPAEASPPSAIVVRCARSITSTTRARTPIWRRTRRPGSPARAASKSNGARSPSTSRFSWAARSSTKKATMSSTRATHTSGAACATPTWIAGARRIAAASHSSAPGEFSTAASRTSVFSTHRNGARATAFTIAPSSVSSGGNSMSEMRGRWALSSRNAGSKRMPSRTISPARGVKSTTASSAKPRNRACSACPAS